MQEPSSRSTSTLELVVNEQQLQNMSQIDLSRPGDENRNDMMRQQQQHGAEQQQSASFSFNHLKEWPARFKENFCSKLDEAKAKSSNNTEFVIQVIQAFSSTAIWILCFFCTIIVPIFLFFIGLFNLDQCQDRPSLPYLVFATGFTMTASNLFNLAMALDLPILTNHHILTNDIKNTIASIINIIFNCVVAFLYVICGYIIYTIGNKNTTTEVVDIDAEIEEMNCNGFLYHFTFWFVTLTLGLFVILSLIASTFFIYNKYRLAIARGSTPRSQQPNISTNPSSAF